MNKEKLKKLMKKYLIFENDIDYVCNFCSELLEEMAKEIEENEPYATNTIKRYKDAAYEIFDLIDYIDEILGGEDE